MDFCSVFNELDFIILSVFRRVYRDFHILCRVLPARIVHHQWQNILHTILSQHRAAHSFRPAMIHPYLGGLICDYLQYSYQWCYNQEQKVRQIFLFGMKNISWYLYFDLWLKSWKARHDVVLWMVIQISQPISNELFSPFEDLVAGSMYMVLPYMKLMFERSFQFKLCLSFWHYIACSKTGLCSFS